MVSILKKGDNMKYIDKFLKCIINIQRRLEKIEGWYISKRKYTIWVVLFFPIIGMFLAYCKQIILAGIVVILGMVFSGLETIVGWKHSVRRWLLVCVVYNFAFSFLLKEIVDEIANKTMDDIVFVIIYLVVWIFLSLISNSKVALLVNEIVSGAAATIFTIGTYLVSMALQNDDTLTSDIERIEMLKSVETLFMLFLPVIGVTALCIIMIKIKGYWMEKNEITEPEKQIGYHE